MTATDTDGDDAIPLVDPDISAAEIEVVTRVLSGASLSDGKLTESFEKEFAAQVGRDYAVAVASGTLALLLALKAYGIGAEDEVLCPPYGWYQTGHAVALAGAAPVFGDIDYWSHTLNPAKAAERLTPRTRAIIAGNTNGHPAAWNELRVLADERGLILIEDSTEAIGSTYHNRLVGGFGDCAVFDFSEPGPLLCGEGGMIVTDDRDLYHELRYLRRREPEHRFATAVTRTVPFQASMSNLNAALGLVQLKRLPEILERRQAVVGWYEAAMQSFEGLKPPYRAPGATRVQPMVYAVHLGTRFTASARNAIVEDLAANDIEAADFGMPLHLQQVYAEGGWKRGDCPVVEKTMERVIALPLHHSVTEDQVAFIVETLKDAATNIGAGAAIYL